MVKFNLQLFAQKLNTGTSIVDYLKSQGEDSSYSARKNLAASMGISNYTGTAEQNMAMLKALKSGSSQQTPQASQQQPATQQPPTQQTPQVSTPAVSSNSNVAGSAVNGVDQATIDKIKSSYSASGQVTGAQAEADKYLNKVKEMAGVTDIVSQDTWDAINKEFASSADYKNSKAQADSYLKQLQELAGAGSPISQDVWDTIGKEFTASQAYNDAMAYTNKLLQQLSSGRTSYTDQINDLMGQIQGRDAFSYDVDTDPLFQQALASAMGSGKTAMQNTMGQAAALTGGYGSTYATSAGNQAYNAYIQDAYNNLPEYYQMALEAYQMEGQEMYDQLSMLSTADAQEYQRMYDSWNSNFSNAQQMYANEYAAWQDSVNNAYNKGNMQMQDYQNRYNSILGAYESTANNAQQMYQNEYTAWRDSVANAMNSAGLQMQEYGQLYDQAYNTYTAVQSNANTLYAQEYQKWADEVANAMSYAGLTNSDYWNTQDFNESVRQFNENLAQNQAQFEQEMAYKSAALEQSQSQWEKEMEQSQTRWEQEVAQWEAEQTQKDTESTGKKPSVSQLENALKLYEEDPDAYNRHLGALKSAGVDVEAVQDYVAEHGSEPKKSLWSRLFGE